MTDVENDDLQHQATVTLKKDLCLNLLCDQAIKLVGVLYRFFDKPRISDISNKKLLTESELALYFGRRKTWTSELRTQGVLMEKIHYHYIDGLIMYNREEIEKAIISNSLR
nr:hypothetical protein [Sulfurospirillum sp. 'SP']